ncbi:cephalosporin hydroxylase family protein [Cupriavidus sp. 2TAF22]|uniref:cephalosporin hydroxylase family protein n=1 Tax=unclassified Cupriavidus TaxID=2640874 RepID=UPI003F92258B
MNPIEQFKQEVQGNIRRLGSEASLRGASLDWMCAVAVGNYAYNFTWLGRPIIQYPQDMAAMQELIWSVRPDLVIEAGIAHGGSLILSASMLAMLDYCDAVEAGTSFDPRASRRRVLGLDIDIRAHNRAAIEKHPMAHKIDMLQGSSIDPAIVAEVHRRAAGYERVLVILDSNHTHDHVLAELEAYAPLTAKGSYCIVFDTLVEDQPEHLSPARPWGKGNNPKTAVWAYLERLRSETVLGADGEPLKFEIDRQVEDKLQITVAPDGYLRRV